MAALLTTNPSLSSTDVVAPLRSPLKPFRPAPDSCLRTSVDDIKGLRLITAIKTPYLPDGRFDLEAYDSLMHMQIVNGAEGNTGSNSTREAIHATEQGFAVGMHAALHINPYYGKTSMQGMVSHFETILSMGPTIIYNVPSRTGQDIPPPVIHTVSRNPNMAGVKECMGNDRIKDYVDKGVVIWSGNDDECHDARWASGATGVISVASNLVPGLMHEIMFQGKNPSLNSKLMPLIKWLFQEPNPIGLNTALAQLGVIRPVFRLPYVPLPLARRLEFVGIVEALGRENFVGEKDVEVLDDDDFVLRTNPRGDYYAQRLRSDLLLAAAAFSVPRNLAPPLPSLAMAMATSLGNKDRQTNAWRRVEESNRNTMVEDMTERLTARPLVKKHGTSFRVVDGGDGSRRHRECVRPPRHREPALQQLPIMSLGERSARKEGFLCSLGELFT
ncbi:Dihydrodipicolinate synthase [Musa troglodytarum]|uniref:Dihydrodipicolinate synthase n=1 Tax=Musa troglodytarum TaxID=320322 RepID=A0A9E7HW29_9LILI|nr:Dihydrodipicolinate synthase [Musa troglodytarum]